MKFLMALLMALCLPLKSFSQIYGAAPVYPIAVSVKTSSYTIPAGRYAKVYVEVENGGTFTIDGNTSMDTDALVNISSVTNSGSNVSYTVPSNYYAIVNAFTAVSGDSTYQVSTSYLSPAGSKSWHGGAHYGGPASVIGVFATSSGARGINGVAIPSNAMNRSAHFTLPAGAIINGTGTWRATVEEYFQ